MSKKETEAYASVLKYMDKQNRPYSTNDIFLNLHKEFGKSAIQKAIDALVHDGKLKEKVYGKQKVYVIDQNQFAPLNQDELTKMDAKIADFNAQLAEKTKLVHVDEMLLKSLKNSITTAEAKLKIQQLQTENEALEEKLASIQKNHVFIPKGEQEIIEQNLNKALKEWKKRKRITMDILDAILEGWPKSKTELFDEIGIETDQDAGVVMPQV